MLLTYCEMLVVGFASAIAQETQSSRPQAEHLKRALCYHGIEGRSSEANGHVTRSHAADAAHA